MKRRADHSGEAGTRALLDGFCEGAPDEVLRLGEVFTGLGRRSFGMLLFVATLPAFIPIPGVAGALSGPLVVLVGLQLLAGRRRPWLPGVLARRGPHRGAMRSFRDRISPWLARLERVVRPRDTAMLDHPVASRLTGVQLMALGVLLFLPIPFTNYLFALLLLLFALALLERDGRLMIAAWVAAAATGAAVALLSNRLAGVFAEWIDLLV